MVDIGHYVRRPAKARRDSRPSKQIVEAYRRRIRLRICDQKEKYFWGFMNGEKSRLFPSI